jgi:hypothetical protein
MLLVYTESVGGLLEISSLNPILFVIRLIANRPEANDACLLLASMKTNLAPFEGVKHRYNSSQSPEFNK